MYKIVGTFSRRKKKSWERDTRRHPRDISNSDRAALSGRHSEKFGNLLLLLREDAKLNKFCQHSPDVNYFVYQRRWLRHVVSHGLCVLKITLSSNYHFELPDCVFNCGTLEEIDLSATKIREVIAPKSVCLPSLEKLNLDFVRFSDSSVVEKLNSGCPALEDLDLSRCSLGFFKISSDTVKFFSITARVYQEIHVSAPNVVSLRLAVSGRVKMDGMPSLLSAWVYVCVGVKHLARGGYDLVDALCNAQHLELFRFGLLAQNFCAKGSMEKSISEVLTFSKLKNLYLGEWLVSDFYQPFVYFLHCAPNLATLTLDQWKLYEENDGSVSDQMPMGKIPSDKLEMVSALSRDLEMLCLRISKGDDAGEFRKMRRLLQEKTKPKETEVVWF